MVNVKERYQNERKRKENDDNNADGWAKSDG